MTRPLRCTKTNDARQLALRIAAGETNLCGRHEELAKLNDIVNTAIEQKQNHVIMVPGVSGAGKSKVVDVFGSSVVQDGDVLFCTGKCDSTMTSTPFTVVKNALSEMAISILANNNEEHGRKLINHAKQIQDSLRVYLGTETEFLTALAPDLGDLIGSKTLGLERTRAPPSTGRINYLFRTLFQCVTKHVPVILYFDDVQWIDQPSLSALRWLACDHCIENLVIIASYRDDEVGPDHPFSKELASIKEQKDSSLIHEIPIKHLSEPKLNDLVADILKRNPTDTTALSNMFYEKTRGNVFYALQLVQVLAKQGNLRYSIVRDRWRWGDIEKIRCDTRLGDDVVSLIRCNLKMLPKRVRYCLTVASFLGTDIDPTLLQILMNDLHKYDRYSKHRPVQERSAITASPIQPMLEEALAEGFILDDSKSKDDSLRYKFAHDRIHQAADSLITDESERSELHHDIAMVLSNHRRMFSGDTRNAINFMLPHHLQLGRSAIADQEGFVFLSKLQLSAGNKSLSMCAFDSAGEYFQLGIDAMNTISSKWNHHTQQMIDLNLGLAKVMLATGSPSRSSDLIEEALPHIEDKATRLSAVKTLVDAYGAQSKHKMAATIGKDELKAIGIYPSMLMLPRTITSILRMRDKLKSMTVEEVAKLKICKDPVVNNTHDLMLSTTSNAFFIGDMAFSAWFAVKSVQQTLEHGVGRPSVNAFSTFAIFLTVIFKETKEACRVGTMSAELMKRFEGGCDAPTIIMNWTCLNPWLQPYSVSIQPLVAAYKTAMKIGDMERACGSFTQYLTCGLASGLSLKTLVNDAANHTITVNESNDDRMRGMLFPLRQYMINLHDITCERPTELTGVAMDAQTFLDKMEGNANAQFSYFLYKANACYHFEAYEEAEKALSKAKPHLVRQSIVTDVAQALVLNALIPLALAHKTGKLIYKRRAQLAIERIHKAITKQNKGMNLAHRLALLEAGYFSLDRKANENAVKEKFDEAIAQATRIGYRQDAALANWHAGEYFLTKKEDTDWAGYYISKARWLYADWEAHRMCEYLKSKYADKINIYQESQTLESSTLYGQQHSVAEQAKIDDFCESLWDESVRLGGIYKTGHAAATRGLGMKGMPKVLLLT